MASSSVYFNKKRRHRNLFSQLRLREMAHPYTRHYSGQSPELVARQFHRFILPNHTVQNANRPAISFVRFSPDGQYLVAFSTILMSVEIFRYRGLHAARRSAAVSSSAAFWSLFAAHRTVAIPQNRTDTFRLHGDCVLFSRSGQFVLVMATAAIEEPQHAPAIDLLHRNNEALTIERDELAPQDYCLLVIRLSDGHLCHQIHFPRDRICPEQGGVYLLDNRLCVLSLLHQRIQVFQLCHVSGKLSLVTELGRFASSLDEAYHEQCLLPTLAGVPRRARNVHLQPMADACFNVLKQKLLAALYRQALHERDSGTDPNAVQKFYRHFDLYRSLRMWRMQLLSGGHVLLIRWAQEKTILGRLSQSKIQVAHSFFMFYRWSSGQVLGLYHSECEQLTSLMEHCAEDFRNTGHQWPVDASCNFWARELCKLNTWLKAEQPALQALGRRKLLHLLPFNCQAFQESPYLDPALFSFDAKTLSNTYRVKALSEYPVKVFDRESEAFAFRLCMSDILPQFASSKQAVFFLFHPWEPLLLSVQRSGLRLEFALNIHLPEPVSDSEPE